uniref:Uncharacterized protein n=1 Tax=Lactuca sativa TaxID=4236 RepID=A0A9R1VUH1_LACSA|nr:hypothetical protein LSAT_V11C400189790 [Lactuca sativa]
MFWQSCIGDYVHMLTGIECHPFLCHYLMCKEATTFDPVDLEELLFLVGDYQVCFDRKAFCLVTGLRFGDYFHPSSNFSAFKEHVFPFVPLSCSVSMDDLTNVFNNSLYQLSNEDVVRVSLLYMLEQGFSEKYPRQPVTNERMALVRTVFDKIEDHLDPNSARIGSRHTYTLQGFVYAIKIWILETFPNNSIVGSPIPGVIPRVISYPRMRRLHAPNCECILEVTNRPLNELLKPTAHECAARWWIESVQWIDVAYYANV